MNWSHNISDISGVILAGGKSSRMGEDKALKKFNKITLIEYTIKRLQHQVNSVTINTNQNLQEYKKLGYPIIEDINPDRLGPLSGIFSSLQNIKTNWGFFSACDTPLLPKNIVARLYDEAQAKNKLIAVAETNNKLQPLVLLLHKNLTQSLNNFINSGDRKTQNWILQHHPAIVDCSKENNSFININTIQDFSDFKTQLQLS
jgi:molybdenum cofactor guanylyltransferase